MGPPVNTMNGQTCKAVNGSSDNVNSKPDIRTQMKTYWQVYSPTLESMMLSHDAPILSIKEQEEVMEYLPPATYKGKEVLELGSGIGRYTTLLGKAGVGQLTAIDFMDSYVKENQKINGHMDNLRFMCADVTKLTFTPCSFDLVFSNWLLMYLTDAEVKSLFQKCLSWLKPGGFLFFRESCYHQSGNVVRKENPTLYRTPLDYVAMVQNAAVEGAIFKLVKAKNIRAYIEHYGNPNQLCFLVQKKDLTVPRKVSLSTAAPDVLLAEALYGASWGLEGGRPLGQFLNSALPPVEGKAVLDANSGTGGLAFAVSQMGAERVHGLAGHHDYLHLTLKNHNKLDKSLYRRVSFESNALSSYQSAFRYDIIVMNFVQSAALTFSTAINKLKVLLNPGGKLILGLYTSSVRNDYPELTAVRSTASDAGFTEITLTDKSQVMSEALSETLSSISTSEQELEAFPEGVRRGFQIDLENKLTQLKSSQSEWTLLECSLAS